MTKLIFYALRKCNKHSRYKTRWGGQEVYVFVFCNLVLLHCQLIWRINVLMLHHYCIAHENPNSVLIPKAIHSYLCYLDTSWKGCANISHNITLINFSLFNQKTRLDYIQNILALWSDVYFNNNVSPDYWVSTLRCQN